MDMLELGGEILVTANAEPSERRATTSASAS
jgi:hypothetical protein